MSRFAIVRILSGAFALSLRTATLAANREIIFPADAATAGQSLRANATNPSALEWYTPSTGGGGTGTVTSVALSAPADVYTVSGSPVTTSGTLSLSYNSQAANTFLAAPSGAAGTPSFRALTATDIPNFDASKIASGTVAFARLPVGTTASTVAAGNDSRFHLANTDTGSTSATFQLDTTNGGVKIKNTAGALEVRNAADTAYADVVVNNLTVRGTTTTVDSNTVNIGDNIINLNADYSGSAPTESAGYSVNRGTLTAAQLIWDESVDRFRGGLVGSEKDLSRTFTTTFTSASLSSGLLTVTHGLDRVTPLFLVWSDTNKPVYPEVSSSTASALVLDFTGITIGSTWSVIVVG